jgi:sugar phosphate isomerase/epimerase
VLAGENPAESAGVLGKRLRYVQVHDTDLRSGVPRLDRHLPLGEGSLKRADVDAVLGRLPVAITITARDDPIAAARAALHWLR